MAAENPVILYDNRFADGTPTANHEDADFPAVNVGDPRTFMVAKGASAATWEISVDAGSADKVADCVAFIGHNFFTSAAQVEVQSSDDGVSWTLRLAAFSPYSDRAQLRTFTQVQARHWKVIVSDPTAIPYLACLFVGQRIDFPFPPETPFTPYQEGVEVESRRSKSGNLLGTTVRYGLLEIDAVFRLIDREEVYGDSGEWGKFLWGSSWGGNNIPFRYFWEVHGCLMKMFFWAWDPGTFPDEVFYVKFRDDYRFATPLSVLAYVDSLTLGMEGIKE
jgi:hypothetical protein